jgi:hypothetical protein
MLDFDPRDYDSRDDERHANTLHRGGRGSSGDRDRDDDWTRHGARARDRMARPCCCNGNDPPADRPSADPVSRVSAPT